MDRRAQITSTPLHVPSVLVVLDPTWLGLFGVCLTAASRCGVMVHRCDAQRAPTAAAERRPLAIVMSNAVYAHDAAEHEALARDVRATLLRVDEEVTERELEAMLAAALRERERESESTSDRARSGEGGRYAVIGGTQEEAPLSRRPPPSLRSGPASVRGGRPTPAPMSAPPPSVRAAYRDAPGAQAIPPPSVRAAYRDAPGAQAIPPPSTRAAYRDAPGAQAIPPPSARAAHRDAAGAGPAAPRTLAPPPWNAPAPRRADPSSPRSGVRERSAEELDAVFDEQSLPLDALAERHRRGPR